MVQINRFKQQFKKNLRRLLLKGAAVLSRERIDPPIEPPKVYVRQASDLPGPPAVEKKIIADPEPVADSGIPVFTPPPVMDEVYLTQHNDIEKMADDVNVPHESVEKLISAGLLYPEEIRTAEKLVRIMRQRGDGAATSGSN